MKRQRVRRNASVLATSPAARPSGPAFTSKAEHVEPIVLRECGKRRDDE